MHICVDKNQDTNKFHQTAFLQPPCINQAFKANKKIETAKSASVSVSKKYYCE